VKIQRRKTMEPTIGDLASIEREWPLIEAEIALLDAEIAILAGSGSPTELDWQRIRRARRRVLREATALRSTGPTDMHLVVA
jgi:Family of unknown function (DUF6284)